MSDHILYFNCIWSSPEMKEQACPYGYYVLLKINQMLKVYAVKFSSIPFPRLLPKFVKSHV